MKKYKIKKAGKLPVNSRIFIDYRGKKPKIKFQYPDKKEPTGSLLTLLISFLLILFLLSSLTSFIGNYAISDETIYHPHNCTIEQDYYSNLTLNLSYVKNITISCDNNITNILTFNIGKTCKNQVLCYFHKFFPLYDEEFASWIIKHELPEIIFKHPIISVLSIFFISIFIYALVIFGMFYINKHLSKLFIKLGYGKIIPIENKLISGRGYYVKFKEVPENKIIEIPLFNNTYLDYKATKEFSKYLERVEITEHPFSKATSRIKKKKRKLKRKKKNTYLWRARFYFSQQTQRGYLEVFFK